MASLPKYQRIIASLRNQIATGALGEGDLLPSYRALMVEHNATVGVVRQAMQVLQSDGVVESVRSVGCRVAKAKVKQRVIGIAIVGFSKKLQELDLIRSLHDDLNRLNCDVAIRLIHSTDDEQVIESACEWAQRLDGVLLTGRVSLALAQRMNAASSALVLIGELLDAPTPPDLSAVSIDVASVANLAVGHLASLGHRRVAVNSGHGTRYYEMLREALESSLGQYNMDGLWLRRGEDGTRPTADVAFRAITSAPNPATAVVVEGGYYASQLIRLFDNAGWHVPQRISVLAISAKTDDVEMRSRLTCILTSTQEMLRRAVHMLADQVDRATPLVRVERLTAAYVPGNTCRSSSP